MFHRESCDSCLRAQLGLFSSVPLKHDLNSKQPARHAIRHLVGTATSTSNSICLRSLEIFIEECSLSPLKYLRPKPGGNRPSLNI